MAKLATAQALKEDRRIETTTLESTDSNPGTPLLLELVGMLLFLFISNVFIWPVTYIQWQSFDRHDEEKLARFGHNEDL